MILILILLFTLFYLSGTLNVLLYLILGLISFSLTYLIKIKAQKNTWVDDRKEKDHYKNSTPTCGGLAIAGTFYLGASYLYWQGQLERQLYWALLPGVPLTFLGFLDDLYNLKQKFRLIIQISAVIGLLAILGGLQQLTLGVASYQNPIALNILALIGVTWVINLYNFQDGIDGYAASEAVFLATAGYLLIGGPLFLTLAFSSGGFLYWNWHKAKIYMGDTGSLFLGYTLATLAIYYQNQGISILNFVVLFTFFWCDSTFTLIRDLWNKENVMKRHKRFIFHKLVTAGWSHSKVVVTVMVLNCLLFSAIALVPSTSILFYLFLSSMGLFITFMILADYLERKQTKQELRSMLTSHDTYSHEKILRNQKKKEYIQSNISFLKKHRSSQEISTKL